MNKKIFQEKIGLSALSFLVVITMGTLFFRSDEVSRSQATTYSQEVTQESEAVQATQLSENDQLTVNLVNELMERLENQEKVDAMIQAEVESGYYIVENPLVILDPYTQSPLTALICFATEQPTRVDIHVEGEDEYTEVNHSFTELTTQHVVPIYGLYPDKLNPVTVWVYDEKGELVGEKVSEIQTEPVSDHFQDLIILTETFQEGYCEGINFLYSDKIAFDKEGDIRWYYSNVNYLDPVEYTSQTRHFLIGQGKYRQGLVLFYDIDKLGKIYKSFYATYGLHHEIFQTTNDSFFALGGNSSSGTIEDFIYEIDQDSGEILHTLDMKYFLQRNRPAWATWEKKGQTNLQDWLHMNSIEYDKTDQTIIISSNYQSCVVKMDWPSGDIHWIMGNHDDWNPRMRQYLLTPTGTDFEWHYNQHTASILPDYDDNPDTIDILLFDNGSTRFFQDSELQRRINNNEVVSPDLYSRIVHYRVNEVTMEVEQIWQYGKEREMQLYSRTMGSVYLLENENLLGLFHHDSLGWDTAFPVLLEVNKTHGLIWESEIFITTADGVRNEYRSERLPFYFDDDAEHDIYTTARNLIPQDIIDFVAEHNEK